MSLRSLGGGSGGGGGSLKITDTFAEFDPANYVAIALNGDASANGLSGWASVSGLLVPPNAAKYGFSPKAMGAEVYNSVQVLKFKCGDTSTDATLQLVARWADNGNYLMCQLNVNTAGPSYRLYNCIAGVDTEVNSFAGVGSPGQFVAGNDYWMTLIVSPTRVIAVVFAIDPMTGRATASMGGSQCFWDLSGGVAPGAAERSLAGQVGRVGFCYAPKALDTSWRFGGYYARQL